MADPTVTPIQTNNDTNQDVFGNNSSSRKIAQGLVLFTKLFVALFAAGVLIGWLTSKDKATYATSAELLYFYFGTVVLLFVAAFVPKEFSKVAEMSAFAKIMVEKFKK